MAITGAGAKGRGVQAARASYQAAAPEQKNDQTLQSNTGLARQPGETEAAYQMRAMQAAQQTQAGINAYNARQPGFWGQIGTAAKNIAPMAIGAATGGPIGMGLGALKSASMVSNEVAQENAANQNVQTAAGDQVRAQQAAANAGRPNGGGVGVTSAPLTSSALPGSGITPQIQGMLANYQDRSAPGVAPVQVGAPQQATAATAVAPTLGPQQRASATLANQTTVGPAAMGTASTTGGATINQTDSNQTRQQQEQSIAGLQGAANGTAPSAAELQLRQTRDANIANQLALASALQGRSVGGALKQASDATGMINAKAASDAAILHAKEQADARGQLSTALEGVRGADVNLATSQGALTNAANITNANNLTGVSQSNAAGQNALTGKQADISSAKSLADANNLTGTSQFNAGQGNQMTQHQADLQSQAGITNANNATSVSQSNAAQANNLISQQATIQQQSALANVDNMLKARGLDDQQRAAYLQAIVNSKGQDLNAATTQRGQDITQQLGMGDLALRQAIADWAKTKDVATGAGAVLSAAGSSDYFKNLFNGGGGVGSSGSGTSLVPTSSVDPSGSGNVDYGTDYIGDQGYT